MPDDSNRRDVEQTNPNASLLATAAAIPRLVVKCS